ncbi:MAG: D-aminoacyl-tRNA deacylase [Acidimicrobiia bacterium]
MRAVVQRVTGARVTVGDEEVGAIGPGLCVLVGVTHDDGPDASRRLADKLWHLRVLADGEGVMNLSAADVGAPILVVSQFTLYGDVSRGRRPSWVAAARPEQAEPTSRLDAQVARTHIGLLLHLRHHRRMAGTQPSPIGRRIGA